jgi:hypothetical protein
MAATQLPGRIRRLSALLGLVLEKHEYVFELKSNYSG